MTMALLLAALLGAGLMFAGWAVFGDEDAVVVPQASAPATTTPHVTTAAEVASAQALDRVKDEAATAAAIVLPDITSEQAASAQALDRIKDEAATAAAIGRSDITSEQAASAQALDRVKDEAATAAAIGRSDITSEQAAAPTSSLAGTTPPAAEAEAKVHADTMRGLGAAGAAAKSP